MLEIREFVETDRPELQQIYLRSRQQTFYWLNTSLFELTDFDKDTVGEEIWVADDGGTLKGFIALWRPDNFIHHLYVHPQFLNKGIGKMLLTKVIEKATEPIALKCMVNNKNALAFYKSQGWRYESEGLNEGGQYYLLVDP
jgi:GNAT superfamily N-acetyltransferase